jgi:hypothetical protein
MPSAWRPPDQSARDQRCLTRRRQHGLPSCTRCTAANRSVLMGKAFSQMIPLRLPGEAPMKGAYGACLLISVGVAAARAEDVRPPAFAYSSSGSCIASALGFNSRLEPINTGVAWRITFNAVGSADANGKAAEAGQSVDSGSFGAGPRMHAPGASAYKDTVTIAVTGPNSDGSSSLHLGIVDGTFTAGPDAGLRFTISDFELKGWTGANGVSFYGSGERPILQTVSISNDTKYQRVCTMLMVIISAKR